MRRLIATLSALAMIGALAGCRHTCGVYDCDIPGHTCWCCNGASITAPGPNPTPAPPLAPVPATAQIGVQPTAMPAGNQEMITIMPAAQAMPQ